MKRSNTGITKPVARAASSIPPSSTWRSRSKCCWTSTCDAARSSFAAAASCSASSSTLSASASRPHSISAAAKFGKQHSSAVNRRWEAARTPAAVEQSPQTGGCGRVPAGPPPRAARLPGPRAKQRASREIQARCGTERPARGDSQRSRQIPAMLPRPSSQARRRSVRAGRPSHSSTVSDTRHRVSEHDGSGRPSHRRSPTRPGGSNPDGQARANRHQAPNRAPDERARATALR